MARMKYEKTISSAGWRRLLRLAILLPATVDLIRHHGDSGGTILSNKELGLILPAAHAISPDQGNYNNHLPQDQQNPQAIQNNYYEGFAETCHSANSIPINNRSEETTKPELRRQAIEIVLSAKRSLGNKIAERELIFSRIFGKNQLRKKDKQTSLQEATRLVGGANHNVEAVEDPQQQDDPTLGSQSNLSPDDNQQKKSTFGYIFPKSKRFFVSEASEDVVRRRFQQTLARTQKISSQAGPTLITAVTLLFSIGMKDEISILTLYTLALLGASCGFHLFLHFITLGYALGVTLPLIMALNSYQVRPLRSRILFVEAMNIFRIDQFVSTHNDSC